MARRTNTTQCLQARAVSAKPNQDQQQVERRTNITQHHPLSAGLYLDLFQTSYVLSCIDSRKTSHSLFSRQLSEKHHMSILSKTSSHTSASAKTSSHKTVSRKTSHDITESQKKNKKFPFHIASKYKASELAVGCPQSSVVWLLHC